MDSLHNRREFLRLGAAAASALAVPSVLSAKADEFSGFKVGAQSYTFRNFKLDAAVKKQSIDMALRQAAFTEAVDEERVRTSPALRSPDGRDA